MRVTFSGLLLIITLLFSINAYSQNTDKWRAGSSKYLNGDIITLICFINEENSSWNITDKSKAISSLEEAQSWIISQANKWSADVNFKNIVINDEIIFKEIEPGLASGTERVDLVYETFKKLGFRNSKQAYRKLSRKYKCSNINVILISNSKGRSYSMSYSLKMDKRKYFLEGMIVFLNYNNNEMAPLAGTFAHELLHLYGAWDLYHTYAQTADRQAIAFDLFPNDIMVRLDYNLDNLTIDKLTAWLIGWNKVEDDNFEWFRPNNRPK